METEESHAWLIQRCSRRLHQNCGSSIFCFKSHNQRLGIRHEMYEKGQPWRNLIESQFGIQARLGEYHWERCRSVEAAVEFHRDLIRDHNRLPHWAHHRRNDGKRSPLAVLGDAKGKRVEPADLERAFGQRYCQRMTDARGFVKIGRWKSYVEEGFAPHPHPDFVLGGPIARRVSISALD